MRYIFLPALLSLILSACGSLVDFGPDRAPASIYRLGVDNTETQNQPVGVLVGLDTPEASEALQGQGIAVSLDSGEIRYLPGADWADRAPRLIARYLGNRISGADELTLLVRAGSGVPLDYRMKVDLHDFSIHPDGSGGQVTISMTVLLLGLNPPEVIARQAFGHETRISGVTAELAVPAFETALAGIAADMEAWLRTHASDQRAREGVSPS